MFPFLILLLGLILIFFEFFLPGAILGTLGGILAIASVFYFAWVFESALYTLLFFLFALTLVFFTIKLAIWKIKNATKDFSIYSEDDQEGFIASSYDKSAVGQTGVVLTDLKPGGYVLVGGKRQLALSQSGYLVKGTKIVVVSGQEESLIVKDVEG